MELLTAAWWSSLMAIVLIDLLLAGDNAIMVALAARSLPRHLQGKAIVWGTVGAVVVRTLMTIGVVWLLRIPGLMLIGGLGLVVIAYRLLADVGHGEEAGPSASTFWGALRTIIVADALMGIDNVLGVAGAAHGRVDLVVAGLLISVPIMVFGSSLVLKVVDRFPIITYLGAGVLGVTAGKMIVSEPWGLKAFFAQRPVAYWGVVVAVTLLILVAGHLAHRRNRRAAIEELNARLGEAEAPAVSEPSEH